MFENGTDERGSRKWKGKGFTNTSGLHLELGLPQGWNCIIREPSILKEVFRVHPKSLPSLWKHSGLPGTSQLSQNLRSSQVQIINFMNRIIPIVSFWCMSLKKTQCSLIIWVCLYGMGILISTPSCHLKVANSSLRNTEMDRNPTTPDGGEEFNSYK